MVLGLGHEYSISSKINSDLAFKRACCEIEIEQKKLRLINPRNPLLNILKIHDSRLDIIPTADFQSRIIEHTDYIDEQEQYDYFLLGRYVELLREEQKYPKFLKY